MARARRSKGNGIGGGGAALALVFALALACSPAGAQTEIGVAEKVVRNVYGDNLNQRMRPGQGLTADQRVRTGSESAAGLAFLDQTTLKLGPRAEVRLDGFVYRPEAGVAEGTLAVVRGLLRFASRTGAVDLRVTTRHAVIGVRGTVFDVHVSARVTEVAVREGSVEVTSAAGSQIVDAGEVLRVGGGGAELSSAPSAELSDAVSVMVALLSESGEPSQESARPAQPAAAPAAGTEDEAVAARAPSSASPGPDPAPWASALIGRDLEDLLLLELVYGPVVIALRPDLAPRHVERIKRLARQGFYDGLAFHNVVPEFAAELSEQPFRRGSIGMKHDRRGPDTADSQFFILYGDAAHLNRRYTYWGEVIHGMQHLDRLRRGSPPRDPDRIVRLRVLGDLAR